jgi:hypothetical protein
MFYATIKNNKLKRGGTLYGWYDTD